MKNDSLHPVGLQYMCHCIQQDSLITGFGYLYGGLLQNKEYYP